MVLLLEVAAGTVPIGVADFVWPSDIESNRVSFSACILQKTKLILLKIF